MNNEMDKNEPHHSADKVMPNDVKPGQENGEATSPRKTIGSLLRDEREKQGL